MTTTAESLPKSQGLRSSTLKRPLQLHSNGQRLQVDADGAVRALYSLEEKRVLFGLEQVWFYKVQAGIVVHAQRPDWGVKVTPRQVRMAGRVFDAEVSQTIELLLGHTVGFLRRISMKNVGQSQVRIRIVELLDPTNAHFDTSGRWGALGVNAFNRASHVAMDEVSDPPSARVSGASPPPSKFYLSSNRQRAQELITLGELPEATAGMSGQVLILSSHELELSPGESKEIAYVSIYNAGKLEEALADFGRLQAGEKPKAPGGAEIACSDQYVTEAASWAVASVRGGAYSEDLLDKYEVLAALSLVDPQLAGRVISAAKEVIRRDGSLPHSLDHSKPGPLETALLLKSATAMSAMSQDKKAARASYPFVKKLAGYLLSSSKDSTILADPSLPQGWRRDLGSGFPTGEIPEVLLAVAAALDGASQMARMVSKSEDAGRYMERSKLICEHVRKTLLDDRGFLSLCRDSSGRLRTDETVDMALAAYRYRFMDSAEQAAAHRLFERDFDTPYGPRSVPSSNQVYFNGAYGEGQLGGVWPRAALAHALLCYKVGLGGVGSLSLAKIARLAVEDIVKLGSSPGMFPHWIDVDGKMVHESDTDPVAAARFLEVLLLGELGLPDGIEKSVLSPPAASTLSWLSASDIWPGDTAAIFLGRGGGRSHVFFSGGKFESKTGIRFAKSERIEIPHRGVRAIGFHTPGQVICAGNVTQAPARFPVSFSPRAAELTKRLSTPLEEYDPAKGSWSKVESIRVGASMSFEAAIEPNGWKAYRVSTP